MAVARDDEELTMLWEDIDLNNNGDVDLNEMVTYMKVRYPILGAMHPLTLAFTETIGGEVKGNANEQMILRR